MATTGDPRLGSAYVDSAGNVHYMPQAQAQDAAGFNSFASKFGRASPYIVGGMMAYPYVAPLFGAGAGGSGTAGAVGTAGTGGTEGAVSMLGTSTAGGAPAFGTGAGLGVAGVEQAIFGGALPATASTPAFAYGATAPNVVASLTRAGVNPSLAQQIGGYLTNPQNFGKLAGLGLAGAQAFGASPFGGGGPDTSGLLAEAQRAMELQRKRSEQTQPIYDTLVNMSYGTAPTQYRGAAPAGYRPSPPATGNLVFRAPQFGRPTV